MRSRPGCTLRSVACSFRDCRGHCGGRRVGRGRPAREHCRGSAGVDRRQRGDAAGSSQRSCKSLLRRAGEVPVTRRGDHAEPARGRRSSRPRRRPPGPTPAPVPSSHTRPPARPSPPSSAVQRSLDASRRAHLIDNVNATRRGHLRKAPGHHPRPPPAREAARGRPARLRPTHSPSCGHRAPQIDSKLAQAEQQDQAAAAAAAAATTSAVATNTAAPATNSAPGASDAPPTTVASGSSSGGAAPSTPAPPSDYAGTPGVSPHHDDPFLTCVRQRESGGNYSVVNPAGPYLGAYQFLQSTWDVAASHEGRSDLVGVPANTASEYDQDETAWALYQWQGAAPWGGSCP